MGVLLKLHFPAVASAGVFLLQDIGFLANACGPLPERKASPVWAFPPPLNDN
jgi:hypothetical protein